MYLTPIPDGQNSVTNDDMCIRLDTIPALDGQTDGTAETILCSASNAC